MENIKTVLYKLLNEKIYTIGENTKSLKGLLKDYQIPTKTVNTIITIANTSSFKEFVENYKNAKDDDERIILRSTLKLQILEEYPFDEIVLAEAISAWAFALNVELQTPDYSQLMKSAEEGNAQAQYEIALMYENENDFEKAAEWYTESAIGLYTKAQLALGICYEEGKGLPKDYEKSFKWYWRASNKMNMEAKLRIGKFYYKGQGTEVDIQKAYDCFLEAADADFAEAAYYVAEMTENGRGTKKDETIAAKWYKKAAKLGCKKSQIRLCEFYQNGIGVAADISKAEFWEHQSKMT